MASDLAGTVYLGLYTTDGTKLYQLGVTANQGAATTGMIRKALVFPTVTRAKDKRRSKGHAPLSRPSHTVKQLLTRDTRGILAVVRSASLSRSTVSRQHIELV